MERSQNVCNFIHNIDVITKISHRPTSKVLQNATQFVKLSGLGTATFEDAYHGLANIHYLFDQHIGNNAILPLPTKLENAELFISASNKIVMRRPVGSKEPHIQFSKDEDPHCSLEQSVARSPKFFRPAKCEVKYFDARPWLAGRSL
jgi:hypothetical protein